MSLDDELRRRMQAAADRAGAGVNPGAVAQTVAAKAATGPRPSFRLIGGLGAVGVMVGGVIGFTALKPTESAGATAVIVETQRYSLYDCPDGGLRGTALPGDRVYVTGRNEAGDWLELRDPRNQSNRAWVPADAVDPDAIVDVPVVQCNPTIELMASVATSSTTVVDTTTTTAIPETTTTVAPTTVPVTVPITTKPTVPATAPSTAPPTVAPTVPSTVPSTAPPTVPPTAPPTLPPDTQKPTVGQAAANPTKIYDSSWSANCASSSVITVSAADNIGVTSVQGTWSGVAGSPKQFVKGAGTTWTLTFGPFSGLASGFNQAVQISIVARDAAGNASTPVNVAVTVNGTCLI